MLCAEPAPFIFSPLINGIILGGGGEGQIRTRSKFVCQACGYETPKWLGRCPECNEWGTLQEEVIVQTRSSAVGSKTATPAAPVKLQEISGSSWTRQTTNIVELDRVLGGGLVPGGVVLVGGDPGIGKSTLLMQLAGRLASRAISVLYVSGEESQQQIKLRADRLQVSDGPIFIAAETELDAINSQLVALQPQVVIIDSIQTVYSANLTSAPGTVGQIRESASRLIRYAKETGTVLFLVGHVTKDGSIAGPRVLEHMWCSTSRAKDTNLFVFCGVLRTVLGPPMRSVFSRWARQGSVRWTILRNCFWVSGQKGLPAR